MDTTDFLWGLKLADQLTMTLVSQVSTVAAGVALICFMCNYAWNYLYHGASQVFTSNEDKFPDMMELARCIVLFFCLTLYTPFVKTVVGTLEVVNRATAMTLDNRNEYMQLFIDHIEKQNEIIDGFDENALQHQIEEGGDLAPGAAMVKDEIQGVDGGSKSVIEMLGDVVGYLNPMKLVAMSIHGIFTLLFLVIALVVLGIAVVIMKILVILGPFVFAFSMLPCFEKQLSVWFGSLCSIGLVFTVINILDNIAYDLLLNMLTSSNIVDTTVAPVQNLAVNMALVGAYCSVFWLGSRIVGSADAGKIISKTMAVGTTAATFAIMGAAMTGGNTSKAVSGFSNAANAAKSIIEE